MSRKMPERGGEPVGVARLKAMSSAGKTMLGLLGARMRMGGKPVTAEHKRQLRQRIVD
jgi:hypothetical protein